MATKKNGKPKKTTKKPARHLQIAELIRKEMENDEAVVFFSDSPKQVPAFSSGLISLDEALGVGGWPQGRIIEVFGPESSGKTTLVLQAAAEAQARGNVVGFIDAEHAIDPSYAEKLGIDLNSWMFSQPDSGEEALTICEKMAEHGQSGDVVIIDSVSALVPQAELDGEMGDAHMGLHARLMSQAMRKLKGTAAKNGVTLFFINQIRMKVGVIFGNPETTSGGRALKFYASVRADVRSKIKIKKGDEVIGYHAEVKIVKNKVARPFRIAKLELYFGSGFSKEHDLIRAGVDSAIIDKSGSWYSYDGERIGQGQDAVFQVLRDDPALYAKVERQVRDVVFRSEASV